MSRWILRVLLCCSFCLPVSSSPIANAIRDGVSLDKFRSLLRHGNIWEHNQAGENLLHIAARYNRPAHLEVLLSETDLNRVFMAGHQRILTPIELSIQLGNYEAFLILLNHLKNPKVRLATYDSVRVGWTLMHLAAFWNRPMMIRALALRCSDLTNAPDATRFQWTPLDIAERYGLNEAIAALDALGGRRARVEPSPFLTAAAAAATVVEPQAAPSEAPSDSQIMRGPSPRLESPLEPAPSLSGWQSNLALSFTVAAAIVFFYVLNGFEHSSAKEFP